jgi:hypothetical protein
MAIDAENQNQNQNLHRTRTDQGSQSVCSILIYPDAKANQTKKVSQVIILK